MYVQIFVSFFYKGGCVLKINHLVFCRHIDLGIENRSNFNSLL